jgi:hypothetical protein
MTARFNGSARLRFFRHGIDQHLDCPETEAAQHRQRLTRQGAYVYRVDYSDTPFTNPEAVSQTAA